MPVLLDDYVLHYYDNEKPADPVELRKSWFYDPYNPAARANEIAAGAPQPSELERLQELKRWTEDVSRKAKP